MAENYVVIDNTIFSRIKEVIIIRSHTKNIFGGDTENYFAEDIEKGYQKDRFIKLIEKNNIYFMVFVLSMGSVNQILFLERKKRSLTSCRINIKYFRHLV